MPDDVQVLAVDELDEERRLLLQAIRARDDVLAVVSHDLRNPLNTIAMAVEHLMLDDLPNEERLHCATAIQRAVGRAARLISDLLDIHRLEQGALSMERRNVDPSTIVRGVAEDHRIASDWSSVTLAVETPDSAGEVFADPDRLHQVLDNLVSNALRHTPYGGRITLRVEPTEEGVRFSVTDTGPGIPADELPRLFDRYYQVNRKDKRGAGLGLAIVKGVVDAHGGTISVACPPEGGSVFAFTIPALPKR